MPLLTKSKYLAGLQCSKLLWHAVNNKDKTQEFSKEAQYRMNIGTQVGILATKLYPEGISIYNQLNSFDPFKPIPLSDDLNFKPHDLILLWQNIHYKNRLII